MEETAALNVETERLITNYWLWQPVSVRYLTRKNNSCLFRAYLQGCTRSFVVTCHQHQTCFAVCWWQALQPYVGPFLFDLFPFYCSGLMQNKHIQVMFWYRFVCLFLYAGRTDVKISTKKAKRCIVLRDFSI